MNAEKSMDTTVHWHGMHQKGTPHMDGTPMTQCPILPGMSFTYSFKAYPAGTHWYHSHVGIQRYDGLAGPLIVKERTGRTGLFDEDDPKQHTIFVQDWLNERTAIDQDVFVDLGGAFRWDFTIMRMIKVSHITNLY
jgi:FtsP/CotA-like multicopper oxidase with cupredoxin domain